MKSGIAAFLIAFCLFGYLDGAAHAQTTPPSAPINPRATLVAGGVDFTWTDTATDEEGFAVSIINEGGTNIFTPNVELYEDRSTLCPGVLHSYSVAAFRFGLYSEWTTPVSAGFPAARPVPPDPPQTFAKSTTQIQVQACSRPCNATGNKLERSSSPTTGFTLLANFTTTCVYIDTPPSVRVPYYYRSIAYNALGDSDPSEVAIASLDRPLPPSQLSGFAISTTQIQVSWLNTLTASSYRLERSISPTSGFSQIYSGGGTYFTDTPPTPNTYYYYRVNAWNSLGFSDYSEPVRVALGTPPADPLQPPTNLHVRK